MIAVLYEHPEWFEPLFAALRRRGVPFVGVTPDRVALPLWGGGVGSGTEGPCRLLFNRMSASAWTRGGPEQLPFAARVIEALEFRGVAVINGSRSLAVETSKVAQLDLFRAMRLTVPRTGLVHDPAEAPRIAREFRFPVLAKPAMGGRGHGVQRFDDLAALEGAAARGEPAPGPDGTLLIQEYHPPAGGRIQRVEVLDGEVLYAMRVTVPERGFNLCPAEVCAVEAGAPLPVERFSPPDAVRSEAIRALARAGADVGSVEYLEVERGSGTPERIYFDLNCLSNFVARPLDVLGFDPWDRLAAWLDGRLALAMAEGRPGFSL